MGSPSTRTGLSLDELSTHWLSPKNRSSACEREADRECRRISQVFERPIEWHTRPGEVVLEPFSGSGTQIIAAEKLARRCRAMELSPAFVDVAVKRWERATDQQAVLDGTEQSFAEVAAERLVEDQPAPAGAPS